MINPEIQRRIRITNWATFFLILYFVIFTEVTLKYGEAIASKMAYPEEFGLYVLFGICILFGWVASLADYAIETTYIPYYK